jgi:hypothetical protein
MRRSPSIVPQSNDRDVYSILDEFGRLGRSWREIDEERTDREAIVTDLMEGQYSNPVRVVAFNTAEHWSRDASEDIADEIAGRCGKDGFDIRPSWKISWNGMAAGGQRNCRCLCAGLPPYKGHGRARGAGVVSRVKTGRLPSRDRSPSPPGRRCKTRQREAWRQSWRCASCAFAGRKNPASRGKATPG